MLDENATLPAAPKSKRMPRESAPVRAPAFSAKEARQIAIWSAKMQRLGVTTEISLDHAFLIEALHVMRAPGGEPSWMVHKTPSGKVAVRWWPGLADIVPTLTESLAMISRAVDALHGVESRVADAAACAPP